MALGGTLANPAAASDNILFGIVPQQSATRLAQVWVPFMNRLSEETGMNIRFATIKEYRVLKNVSRKALTNWLT